MTQQFDQYPSYNPVLFTMDMTFGGIRWVLTASSIAFLYNLCKRLLRGDEEDNALLGSTQD
jgi:hypothetical protein